MRFMCQLGYHTDITNAEAFRMCVGKLFGVSRIYNTPKMKLNRLWWLPVDYTITGPCLMRAI
jgi:hypothetical protein